MRPLAACKKFYIGFREKSNLKRLFGNKIRPQMLATAIIIILQAPEIRSAALAVGATSALVIGYAIK